jgi:hypothetical protein
MSGRARLAVVLGVIASAVQAGSAALATTSLQGTYRVTLAKRELAGAAAVGLLADNDLGTWTLTIGNGRWTLRQSGGIYGNTLDKGTFAARGRTLAFTLASGYGYHHRQFLGSARWDKSSAGLRFTPVGPPQVDVVYVLSVKAWRQLS